MSLEQRLGVELEKIRSYGSPIALFPYGRGIFIAWKNVSEVWCDADADEVRRNQERARSMKALADKLRATAETPFLFWAGGECWRAT